MCTNLCSCDAENRLVFSASMANVCRVAIQLLRNHIDFDECKPVAVFLVTVSIDDPNRKSLSSQHQPIKCQIKKAAGILHQNPLNEMILRTNLPTETTKQNHNPSINRHNSSTNVTFKQVLTRCQTKKQK
jgi:hypothetical protein